jgi:hypothetical protein
LPPRTPFVVSESTLGPDAAAGAVARVILHNVQIAVHEWSTAAFAPYQMTDRRRQELDQLPPR